MHEAPSEVFHKNSTVLAYCMIYTQFAIVYWMVMKCSGYHYVCYYLIVGIDMKKMTTKFFALKNTLK